MSGISPEQSFAWQPCPDAWKWLQTVVDDGCRENPNVQSLRSDMLSQTGTRIVDWIDHLALEQDDVDDQTLLELGFAFDEHQVAWCHVRGLFPRVVRPADEGFPYRGMAIKVESVETFCQVHATNSLAARSVVQGGQLSYAAVGPSERFELVVVERHGEPGWTSQSASGQQQATVKATIRRFDHRRRPMNDIPAGYDDAAEIFDEAAATLGRDWACDLFFASERSYWQKRNHAARVQRERQDRLGLGWANHDHHTYRCSREHFAPLVGLLEHMGFRCRERFFAGAEAGWGAQVLEHEACGLVVFADVDLAPQEVSGDFAHQGLPPRDTLGTVGLWCKLHGEAIMKAGMHHLECQFDFDAARRQLSELGVDTMQPFTDLPHLRQAFTEGESWKVSSARLNQLVAAHDITMAQANEFEDRGARGSHLEILERNDGYKGFNQAGISEIIGQTDPRL